MIFRARVSIVSTFFVTIVIVSSRWAQGQIADAIYTGGDVVTMNRHQPRAETVAVKDGKIIAVGTRDQVARDHKGPATRVVELGGKTLMPGFIDAHSHYFSSLTVANQVNVYAPPAGPGRDPPSIVAELVKFRDRHKVPRGEVIQAYGYDQNLMPGGRGLTRDDLDAEFPDNPVLVGHVSMHGAVLNSAALKKWKITAETKTPPGGVIVRKPGSNEPSGLVIETAYLPIFASLPKPTRDQEVAWSRAGQILYAQAGITTAHEGATHADDLEVISPLDALEAMTINVAYQYGEQAAKGSLEPGKLADLVILDQNPLKVDPLNIKDIKVLQTIKEGKTIYKPE